MQALELNALLQQEVGENYKNKHDRKKIQLECSIEDTLARNVELAKRELSLLS